MTTRREFLKLAALGAGGAALARMGAGLSGAAESAAFVPVRQITRGPKFHWFGYYDRLQFDPTCRYALANEVDFEHRSPQPDDVIKVGMVDLADGNRWIELGQSRAWCWQQTCALQWRPGSSSEIVWNDREGDRYVCHILDVKSRKRRTLPHPIYALSPDGKWGIAPSFSRLADLRPGYGYAGVPDPFREVPAPKETGIFRVDLETGKQDLLVSVADAVRLPFDFDVPSDTRHWFNHLLVSPDGSRFVVLHRWLVDKGRRTRMLSVKPDGSDLRVLIGTGWVSHFIWRDPAHVLAYSKTSYEAPKWGFYLWEDKPRGAVEPVGLDVMTGDGHCNYLPGNRWILNDTYPDRNRDQHVYLYNVAEGRRVPLGAFQLPREYTGEWRCDTHPRISPDGRTAAIDSPHTGQGRQVHLLDLSRFAG